MLNRRLAIAAIIAAFAIIFCAPLPAQAQVNYTWSMVAQASPDECYQGDISVAPLTPEQVAANNLSFNSHYPAGLSAADIQTCKEGGGKPKVNQAYVWGLTKVEKNLWFSTVANTLCLVMDTFYGTTPSPYQNGSWVCDMNNGEDFKPPRVFVYNSATGTLTDLTQKILNAGATDTARLKRTFGLRSAGNFGGVVFFGGLVTGSGGRGSVVMYAFNAETQQYLGSYLFDGSDEQHPYYNNIRQWHVISNQLFTGVAQTGGGSILRWTGSVANPFSFAVVGTIGGDPAYFIEHKGNIYVSTWGAAGGLSGMSLYMSPSLHGELGLEEADAASWTEVWNLANYEVEPTAAQGGGALASFNGYLYWGTMHVPGTGAVAFQRAHPEAVVDINTFINTTRSIAIFRSEGFDPAQYASPYVQLLYGESQLPQYDPSTGTWITVSNNMYQSPLYGPSGFGNPFNNYTWTMEVFDGKLYVGTMDWSYLATNGNESTDIPPLVKALAPAFYGADLWAFSDANSAAVPVSISGMGNYTSYGIRTMVSDNEGLWIGMANPMNLRSDTANYPGGWKLIEFPVQTGAPEITWHNPPDVTYGTALGANQLNATANLQGSFIYSPPAGTLLNAGDNQVLSATFTPFNSGNQWSRTVSLNVNPAPLSAVAANATMTYGTALPSFTGNLTGVVNNDGITATYSSSATNASPAGDYDIVPTLGDPNTRLTNYAVTITNGKLTINKASSSATVTVSSPNVLVHNSITFSAHVASGTTGVPTGTVNFMDGTTSLGTATLNDSGNASLSLTTLAAGAHAVTAVYAGDANFLASTSAGSAAANIVDFQVGAGSTFSATVRRGGTATYSVNIAPMYSSYFPNDVTLALTGAPGGSTTSVTPTTITAGSASQVVNVQVQTSTTTAALRNTSAFGISVFAIALFPLGLVSLRRRSRKAALLLALVLALGVLGSVGCGDSTPPPPQNYTMTLTATSGGVQHNVTLNLTVQQ